MERIEVTGLHELFNLAGPTEAELQKECTQVGAHLYTRSRARLDFKSASMTKNGDVPVVFVMGGNGVRLQHVTGGMISKHMIQVKGKYLSQYPFDLWRQQGFSVFRMLIDDSPPSRTVRDFYGDGTQFGVGIEYSVEHSKLGTGGAVKEAICNGIINRSFVMHYPDDQVVGYPAFPSDFRIVAMAAFESGYQVVVACVPGTVYPWGEIVDSGGEVVDFTEKPFVSMDSYIGICAISDGVFERIKEIDTSQVVKLERSVFREIARDRKMFKVLIPTENWIPVNDTPGLQRFEQVAGIKAGETIGKS